MKQIAVMPKLFRITEREYRITKKYTAYRPVDVWELREHGGGLGIVFCRVSFLIWGSPYSVRLAVINHLSGAAPIKFGEWK